MGSFIYIMGKSSSGKDTVNRLLQKKMGLKCYTMYTTRPIRTGEKEGVDYFYVTNEKIEELRSQGKIIESRTYNTALGPWTYATVDDGQFDGKNNLLCVGTLESYTKVKEYFDKDKEKKLIPIYIEIDEEERVKRAFYREFREENHKYDEVDRRIRADNLDFSEEKLIQAGIEKENRFQNYNLDKCVSQVIEYIERKTNYNDFKQRNNVDIGENER